MAAAASTPRPSVFVGSSSEGIYFARAVKAALKRHAEVTVWDEGGVFQLGQTPVESLTAALSRFDFAVLVFTPDDVIRSRFVGLLCPRDNVIFELGFFMGTLGRDRTFILEQGDAKLKVPSDLAGLNTATYVWSGTDGDHGAAVATACDRILGRIRALGCRNGTLSTQFGGCKIRVVNGRLEDYPAEPETVVVLPCNEYFDDRCAYDTKSALGAFVNKVFAGEVDAFINAFTEECKKSLGRSEEQQKTTKERAKSFGAGHAVLLREPLGRKTPVGLVSTTTQRAGQGLAAKTSYLFDGLCALIKCLADARLHDVVMPILGAGHGCIAPRLAFVSLVLAIVEALRSLGGGGPLKTVTIVVFQRDAASQPEVPPEVVKCVLELVGSRDR